MYSIKKKLLRNKYYPGQKCLNKYKTIIRLMTMQYTYIEALKNVTNKIQEFKSHSDSILHL